MVTSGDNYSYVSVTDIAYLISEDKYIFAILRSGRKCLTEYNNLQTLEDELDSEQFFRVSRSLIISISSVDKVSRYFAGRLKGYIRVETGESIDFVVSAARRKNFLSWLGGET